MKFNKIKDSCWILGQGCAPYIAVIIGLCIFRNAWLSLFLYHLQIILYLSIFKTNLNIRPLLFYGFSKKYFYIFVLPLLLFGPILYYFLPYVIKPSVYLKDWLSAHGLDSFSFKCLIPYFCIVHPVLEEIHWGKLRKCSSFIFPMSILFAGYHIMALYTFVKISWLILIFFILVLVFYIWMYLHNKLTGGLIPFLSHFVADIGIILAVYFYVF